MTQQYTPKQIRELAQAINNASEAQVNDISIGAVLDKMALSRKIAISENIIAAKKQLAIAEHKQTATLNGYIRAIASIDNPLQTVLEVFITSFTANKNQQGIRRSEAQNIIKSALNSPLKINYDTLSHRDAIPVGTITQVEDTEDRIMGRAVLWNDLASDVDMMLKSSATLGTSWEIYFDPDKTVVENGVSWLAGIVFAGLCVVDTPAYGTEARLKVRS